MTKVKSITLLTNGRHLAKLTTQTSPNLSLQSNHLEFLIDKIESFGNFDFYKTNLNDQYRIGLLEAKLTLEIILEIDSKNQTFEINGHVKSVEFTRDLEFYDSEIETYRVRRNIKTALNYPSSSFYYDISAEVEFVEED